MQCSCYARRPRAWNPLCFASDPAKTWRGWLYRQLGCPSRHWAGPAHFEFLLLMPIGTLAIEGVFVKVTTSQASNALAQNVNRILSVSGAHSFRQCSSTSEKSNIFSSVWISGLTHFYQCFSWARLGLDKAQFWANPFFPMFLLGWIWARFGLSPFFQCFSWARLRLDQAQFWV